MQRWMVWVGILCVLGWATAAWGQSSDNLFDNFDSFGADTGAFAGFGGAAEEISLEANFEIVEGTREGRLQVTATLAGDWHVYSVTQPAGGPERSKFELKEGADAKLVGAFQPDTPPIVRQLPYFSAPVEEHYGSVTWTAPIDLSEGVEPGDANVTLLFTGQICQDEGACIPVSEELEATFAGHYVPEHQAGTFHGENNRVQIQGVLQPRAVMPGQTAHIKLTATAAEGWSVYAYAPRDPNLISKPTLIVLTEHGPLNPGPPVASHEPREKETGLEQEPVSRYHKEPVTWTVPLDVPEDVEPGSYEISGIIGFQACTDTACDVPQAAQFVARIQVGEESEAASPLAFSGSTYREAAQQAAQSSTDTADAGSASGFNEALLQLDQSSRNQTWYAVIVIALAGGFILNFMPCVLPVIGLKVMAFVEQAGQSRLRALLLNLWYVAGMLLVFMILATLAAGWNLGWGQQHQSVVFNVTLAAIVFVMGLSFLGVWEIPIPGFVGSGKASEMAQKEGVSGAFAKGILTTILAVPCSGPLLATALAWSYGQTPLLIYVTFLFLGLGMALPYLVIGVFPSLVRFLPKPGEWMETFKNVMGFVLLATVVWILSYIRWEYLLPTITLLFGLWATCWWIGRTPAWADRRQKAISWAGGIAFASVIGLFAFGWLDDVMRQRFMASVDRAVTEQQLAVEQAAARPNPHSLPWRPYSTEKLKELTASGHTVMVDFTADWCPNCKWLEQTVLSTEQVRSAVERNNVVPLIADWTDRDPEISRMLELLGTKAIPVLAIFPADRPNEPIVLEGWYTRNTILQKLAEAGPSRTGETTTAMADGRSR